MKLGDDEVVLFATTMVLAFRIADKGGGELGASRVTAEETRKVKGAVTKEFEKFKKRAKVARRKVN